MSDKAIRAILIGFAALLFVAMPLRATRAAQPAATPASPATSAPPPQLRKLLNLLADPRLQVWLEKQRIHEPAPTSTLGVASDLVLQFSADRVEAVHRQIAILSRAFPDLPSEFARAWARLRTQVAGRSIARILSLLILFAGLGGSAQWLFRKATRRLRRALDEQPAATARDRLVVIGGRLILAIGAGTAFALGSIGAFLAFDWPPLLREIILGYLAAVLAIGIATAVGRALLAPEAERLRIVPVTTPVARFWLDRMTLFVGWFAIGFVTIGVLRTLGFSLPGRQLVGYALGLGLLAIALDAVWRRPAGQEDDATPADLAKPGIAKPGIAKPGWTALISAAILLLWALWVVRAMPAFWLLLVVVATPLACRISTRAVEHLLRPVDRAAQAVGPRVAAILFDRGIRAVLIILAIVVVGWGWGIDIKLPTVGDTPAARVLRSGLSAVVIALIADLVWHCAKTAIDGALAETADFAHRNTSEARRRGRLRTLLPILRLSLLVVVVTVAALMILAALGVQIGPLIAGAGVVGIALGFGAQTFVRDVIAGMFYLIDDAFRLGEYIQSGNYRGTVESFGIRSVRLRHHRGPVYTVPFSLLGAVENMSRDWVIDKLLIAVTYDSDLDRAKKLIKEIGRELAESPDFAPLIIEPLKMQGVEKLREGAVEIRLKIMTLPGEQFVIRRRAYAMVKKAFEENGIKFAVPFVQVASDATAGEPAAAGADQALALVESHKIA